MKPVLIALLVCFSGMAVGQTIPSTKTPTYVQISSTQDDPVGTQFAYDFREAIRRSAAFELTDDSDVLWMRTARYNWEPIPDYGTLYVELVSVTSHEGPTRNQIGAISIVTRASYSATVVGVELQHEVILVGSSPEEINKAAQGVLATLDANLTSARRELKTINDWKAANPDAAKTMKGKTP
jgi:hypothetical protein